MTIPWSSRELCLKTLLERPDSIVLSFGRTKASSAFEVKLRGKAGGLLTSIQTRQFMASAFLFEEIFSVTGSLSRYLQTVDLSKAVLMINSGITSLQKIRDIPDDIFQLIADDDFKTQNGERRTFITGVDCLELKTTQQRTLKLPGWVTHFMSFWTKCCGGQ